jgi:hypothetical protein
VVFTLGECLDSDRYLTPSATYGRSKDKGAARFHKGDKRAAPFAEK